MNTKKKKKTEMEEEKESEEKESEDLIWKCPPVTDSYRWKWLQGKNR